MQLPDLTLYLEMISGQEVIQVKQRPDLFHFRLKVTLINGTILHVRENHLPVLEWHEYSYQWQTADNVLIARWDNAHERHTQSVPPHHQHVGSEENVLPSEPMTLEKVLQHISRQLATSN
ncbi:DUF6516 family protein [Spirosoma soli]|uniref:DUF6516 family protein n=1 Tax=Spirosoma soli TaxID=1770529 RepID=A0ABW5LWC3_9BACT